MYFLSLLATPPSVTLVQQSLHHSTEDFFPRLNPESSLKTVQSFLSDESQLCLLRPSGSLKGRFLWSLNYFRHVGGCLLTQEHSI